METREANYNNAHTFRLSYSFRIGGEFLILAEFRVNSDSCAEKSTRVKVVDRIKIRNVTRYNGAMAVGGKQRDKAPATKEDGPTTSYRVDSQVLSERRRTRENERAREPIILNGW